MKRLLDLAVGSLIALAALPALATLAIVGAVVWRANPFFVQERVGRSGRTFRLWKLRSLPTCAPAYADKYALAGVAIPRYGVWLRRLHLDELPQIFHVITNRMSLVGPRPEMPFLHDQMPDDFAAERVVVRPGLTGLWQISPAVDGLIVEAPEYDRAYVAAHRVRLDIWILYRTAVQMLGASPVTLAEIPAWVSPREIGSFYYLKLIHRIYPEERSPTAVVGSHRLFYTGINRPVCVVIWLPCSTVRSPSAAGPFPGA